MTLRFKLPPGGDVPPLTAARRIGLTLEAFKEALPDLLARGFPAAQDITGNFSLEAIDAWLKIDAKSVVTLARAQGFNTKPDVAGIGFVYFIRGADLVKIGRALNPYRRILGLQLGSPVRLSIVCVVPGGPGLEKTLHSFYKVERRHGEWFEPSPRLELYIERARHFGFAHDMGHSEAGELILPHHDLRAGTS